MLSQRGDDKSLRTKVAQERRDILIHHSPGMPMFTGKSDIDPLKMLVCRAEVILIGKVVRQKSELTMDEQHVQTLVEIKPLKFLTLSTEERGTKTPVLIVRPGGTVKIGDYSVFENYASYEPLIENQIYLFLLRRSTRTAHYESVDAFGVFHLKNDRLKKTTGEPGDHELEGPIGLSSKKIEKTLLACSGGE